MLSRVASILRTTMSNIPATLVNKGNMLCSISVVVHRKDRANIVLCRKICKTTKSTKYLQNGSVSDRSAKGEITATDLYNWMPGMVKHPECLGRK